eukprot:gene13238-biopygen12544
MVYSMLRLAKWQISAAACKLVNSARLARGRSWYAACCGLQGGQFRLRLAKWLISRGLPDVRHGIQARLARCHGMQACCGLQSCQIPCLMYSRLCFAYHPCRSPSGAARGIWKVMELDEKKLQSVGTAAVTIVRVNC